MFDRIWQSEILSRFRNKTSRRATRNNKGARLSLCSNAFCFNGIEEYEGRALLLFSRGMTKKFQRRSRRNIQVAYYFFAALSSLGLRLSGKVVRSMGKREKENKRSYFSNVSRKTISWKEIQHRLWIAFDTMLLEIYFIQRQSNTQMCNTIRKHRSNLNSQMCENVSVTFPHRWMQLSIFCLFPRGFVRVDIILRHEH